MWCWVDSERLSEGFLARGFVDAALSPGGEHTTRGGDWECETRGQINLKLSLMVRVT